MKRKNIIITGILFLVISILIFTYILNTDKVDTSKHDPSDEFLLFEDKFIDQKHISNSNQIITGMNDDGIGQWAKLTLLSRSISEYSVASDSNTFKKYNSGTPVTSFSSIKSCINNKRINSDSDYEWYCYIAKRVEDIERISIIKTNNFIDWWDEEEIIKTSCDSAFEPTNPKVIYWNDTYLLYATTRRPGSYGTHICLYTSRDGYKFLPHGSVYNNREVVVKAVPIIINGSVYLFYEHQSGCGGAINCNYLLKSSNGGYDFTPVGKVLQNGNTGEWDDDHVVVRQIIKIEDKLWQFYAGEYPSKWTNSDTGAAVGFAFAESNSINDESKFSTTATWTKGNNPILRPDASDWDDSSTYLGDVIYHNGLLHIISSSANKKGDHGDNIATLKFDHASFGNLTSTIITLPLGKTWKTFIANINKPIGTNLSFSILDSSDNLLLSKLDGNYNDISSISASKIKLFAEFTTTDVNETSILKEWSILAR